MESVVSPLVEGLGSNRLPCCFHRRNCSYVSLKNHRRSRQWWADWSQYHWQCCENIWWAERKYVKNVFQSLSLVDHRTKHSQSINSLQLKFRGPIETWIAEIWFHCIVVISYKVSRAWAPVSNQLLKSLNSWRCESEGEEKSKRMDKSRHGRRASGSEW